VRRLRTTQPLPRTRVTQHAHERLDERAIPDEELAAVLVSAARMVDAIDRHAPDKVRIRHRGITVVLAPGRVVVSAWRGR
jgi:hypothetical protein